MREICTSRFTKCCACHEIYTLRFTKRCACHFEVHKALCHELCTLRFTKCCACHELGTSRFTCHSPAKAFRRKNASKDDIQMPKRSFRGRLPRICEPHVEMSRFPAPVEKLEHVQDHRHIQSGAPATESALRSTAASHEKSTLDHRNTRFPSCACHEKWPPCTKMRTALRREPSTRLGHPDSASLRSRNALRGFREA